MNDIKDIVSKLNMMATNLIGEVAVGNKAATTYYNTLNTAIELLEKQIPQKPIPLTLKELGNKINEPVYVVDNVDKWFSGWYLVRDVDDGKVELNDECYIMVKDIGKNVMFYAYELGEVNE